MSVSTIAIKNVYYDDKDREGRKLKSPRWTVITESGERYSTFDAKVGRLAEENKGNTIEAQLEQNGAYTNLVGIVPVGTPSTHQRPRHPSESRLIIRQVALKCVTELISAGQMSKDQWKVQATAFADWIAEEEDARLMSSA